MSYSLAFIKKTENLDEKDRDIGENIFFDCLPYNYQVYLFYYPGAMPNEDLESKLQSFGNITGNNLFINIGRFNDPNYGKIVCIFEITKNPVLIVRDIDKLASIETKPNYSTAYVRISLDRELRDQDHLILNNK